MYLIKVGELIYISFVVFYHFNFFVLCEVTTKGGISDEECKSSCGNVIGDLSSVPLFF
jgi:hypothetical protein